MMLLKNYPDKEAVEYVLAQRKAGMTDEQIRQNLEMAGWDKGRAEMVVSKAGLVNMLTADRSGERKRRNRLRWKLIVITGVMYAAMWWYFSMAR